MVDLIKKRGKLIWYIAIGIFFLIIYFLGGLDFFGIVELKGGSTKQMVAVIMDMHSRIASFWLIPTSVLGILLEVFLDKSEKESNDKNFLNYFFIFTIIMCFVILIGVFRRI